MRRSTRWIGIVLATAVAAGFGLRLIGLRFGLPAVYNPDEVAIMSRALAFAKGDLDPHNFVYPTFYFYALFVWIGLSAVWAVVTGAVASFGAFQREFFLDPTRVYVAGRLLSAILGTATIGAVFVLGRRAGGAVAGLCAAVFLAVAPLPVLDAHYVKHDVPVTFLIVLAYITYMRLWTRDHPARRDLVVASALTGAAFSTHYYAIFLAIPLAWSAACGGRSVRERLARVAAAAVISAAVFFLLSPFLLVEPLTALRDMHANRQIVIDRAVGTLGYGDTALRYATMLWRDTAGWPIALLGAVGLAASAIRWPRTMLRLLAFPLPFLVFIASTYPASRYLNPVAPFLCLFAGIGVATIAFRWPRLATVVVIAVLVLPVRDAIRADLFIRRTDTRTLALRFIDAHVPAGATILTQPYSVPLTPTRACLEEAVTRTGKPMPVKTQLELARQPYPEPAYRLVYLGYGLDADKIYLPYEQLAREGPLTALRAEHVAFVVLKGYNTADSAVQPLATALSRSARRLAEFTPYRTDAGDGSRPQPFLHNTDSRIDDALARPGPVLEIWQLDGPGS